MSIVYALIIAAGAGIIIRVMYGAVNKRGNHSYVKRTMGIFAGYAAILIICMLVNFVIPGKGTADLKQADEKELDRISQELYDAALAGRMDQVDKSFLQKTWSFDYREPKLEFLVNSENYVNVSVFVERKAVDDGRIEAGFYQNGLNIDNININELQDSPRLELEDDQLVIMKPIKTKLKFSKFGSVFSVNQFTGETSLGSGSISTGPNILYIKIPKNLELTAQNDLDIQFVN